MATDKQLAANRENSKKSTGPTTPGGKVISSMNALKSGIDIRSEMIRPESEADLARLTTEYYADFAPANAIERALVDQLIRNEWLNRRYAAVEPALWEKAFRYTESEDLGRSFVDFDERLMKLDRLRNSAQRNYAKALKELMALRKARNAETPTHGHERPEPEQPESLSPELASFDTFPEPRNPYLLNPIEIDPPEDENPPIAA